MLLRTSKDIGALIRERRREFKLDQQTLADRVGVGRKWIVELEAGKPTKELQLVLRTLDALGVRLTADAPKRVRRGPALPTPDIDAIVSAARKR